MNISVTGSTYVVFNNNNGLPLFTELAKNNEQDLHDLEYKIIKQQFHNLQRVQKSIIYRFLPLYQINFKSNFWT